AALAAGTVAGVAAEYGIAHLALSPAAGDGEAAAAVLAVLGSLDAPDGRARVCLAAPHPATRPLLAAGWHLEFIDVFLAPGPGPGLPARAAPGHQAAAGRGLARGFHGCFHGDRAGAARPAPRRPLPRPRLTAARPAAR